MIFPQLLENALSPNPGQGRSGLIATIPPATRRRKSWAKVSAPQEAPVSSMVAYTTGRANIAAYRPINILSVTQTDHWCLTVEAMHLESS